MLDDALEDGTAVRDRARDQSERNREKAEAKAQEIIEDAESYADQVRETTRRRVAELEEHLRRHQRLRAREQELRHILSQIEDMIPKLRGEMDDTEARQESKA
jgi:cell division septum initiation protein DivIVA